MMMSLSRAMSSTGKGNPTGMPMLTSVQLWKLKRRTMGNISGVAGRSMAVAEAVHEVRAGRMVLICDDETRENETDLCLAAQFATPQAINFIAHAACGLICVALAGERLDALRIPLVERRGAPLQGTAFTASVDALRGTTTGISARDRAVS